MKHTYYLLAILLMAFSGTYTYGQSTWSNTASGTWNTAGNWSPSGAPGAATVAQFTANPTSGSSVSLSAATNPAAVYVTSSHAASLNIGNSALSSSTLTLSGGTVNSTANVVIANYAANTATLNFIPGLFGLPVAIGANKVILAGAGTSLSQGNTISIASVVSGSAPTFLGGGTWDGATGANGGVLRLSGSNSSLTGVFTVGSSTSTYNSGVLELDATGALPASASVVINPFSQLYLNLGSSGTYSGGALTLNGTGNNASAYGRGALRSGATACTWPGNILLNTNTVIYAGGTLTLTGNIGGAGLSKEGVGNLIIKGTSNTLSGTITISEGTLTVASGSSLGSGNDLVFNQYAGANPALALNASQTVSSLSSNFTDVSGTAVNTLNLASGTTLTISQASNTTFGSGGVSTLTSIITGAGSIIKTGGGRLTLNNDGHTFYGGLTVAAGELRFCPSASTTLGTGSNLCPLNMTGGIFSTTGIAASAVFSLGVLNNISNATLTLDSATVHTINFSGLGTNTGLLTVTGWKGAFNGTTGTKGKIFIGSSASLTNAQLAQIQFTDGVRIIPATQLSTGEVVPRAPINITVASYGPFLNNVANTISVSYSTPATYFTGVFKVQLSSATGTFANFTSNIIGTGTSATSGTISATIPANTAIGNYRVRVVNSAPYAVASDDNGSDIEIDNAIPYVTSVSSYTSTVPGDTITITGQRFDTILSKNLVYFGPVKAHPFSGNTTSLQVVMPFGGTVGPVTVYDTATHWAGSSVLPFIPAYNNVFFESNSISFQPKVDYMVRTCPNIAAIGDLDGDNVPDLVTVNKISRNITILQNRNGSITSYDTVLTLTCQGNPSNVKIADIDGDGRQDIIVATGSGGSSIGIFRNTTNFSSATPRTISFATRSDIVINSISTHPGVLGIGDFDNDGRLDIAAACYAPSSPFKMVVLRNNNSPGATNSFTLYGFNTGTSSNPSASLTSSITVGDFNNDHLPDLAVVTQDYVSAGTLSVFKNTSAGQGDISFASPLALSTGVYPLDVTSGDMDGDGKIDIVTSQSYSNSVSIYRNTYTSPATLSFAAASTISSSLSTPSGLALGDIDADGKPDIVVCNFVYSGSVTIFRNTSTSGSPSFVNAGSLTTGKYPAGVSIGDLDRDGYPDIVTGNTGNDTGNTISILRNTPVPAIGSISPASPVVCQSAALSLTYSLAVPNGETGAWSSSNASIATVDAISGVVYGVSAGTVTITYTVTVTNGNISRYTTRNLTVNPLPSVSVSGFHNVCQGATTTLSGTPSGGSWSHANAVATVSASGAVTGVAASGTDIITYSYTSGLGCTNIDTYAMSIIVAPDPGTITGADSVCAGANSLYLTTGDPGGLWYTSDDFLLSIDPSSGMATGVATGAASIGYQLTSGCGTFTSFKSVFVKPLPDVPAISGPSSVCAGAAISLTSTSPGGVWSTSNATLATVNNSGVVTGVATGTPDISYTVSNSCGSTPNYTSISVNDVPGVPPAITGTNVLCVDGNTALADSIAGGTWYSGNTSLATVSATGVVYGVSPGNPVISYTISNSCGMSAPVTLAVNVLAYPDANITSAPAPCTGHASNIVIDGSNGANITYNVDGGSYQDGTLTGGTFSFSSGNISSSHTYLLHTISNAACILFKDTSVILTPQMLTWAGGAGGAETDWTNTTNWSCGIIPSATDDLVIPAVTYLPAIPSSYNAYVGNLTIDSSAGVSIGLGSTLNIVAGMHNNGAISGPGTAVLNGNTNQVITGTGLVDRLQLDNAAGATIDSGAHMVVGNVLAISAGFLVTNDSLELASNDTDATARVAPLPPGTGITGRVKIDQYVQGGYRRYRFWAHPFNHAISLGQVQHYIDITGQGGAANGFTTTSTNAPSAFRLNTYVSNSSMSYDPGWKPYTKINGAAADSNMIHQYQGIRLFFRGAKGEGLGYAFNYTPSPVTVKMLGTINQGPQTIHISKGVNDTADLADYNMVGNPYPSPVDIGTVVYNAKQSGNINGSAFFVWNASLGAAGQYMAVPIGVGAPQPYYIQANACFEVRAAHDGDSLNFSETDKGVSVDNYLFKKIDNDLVISIYDQQYHPWDMLRIRFDSAATPRNDNVYDAIKPSGADFSFCSMSTDGKKLAIDVRPFDKEPVKLYVASPYKQTFVMRIDNKGDIPGDIYLHDKLKNTYRKITQGAEYQFDITDDKLSQGSERFELKQLIFESGDKSVTLSPNPATQYVRLNFSGQCASSVAILDMFGKCVYTTTITNPAAFVDVSVADLPDGAYIVASHIDGHDVYSSLIKN